MTEGGHSFTPSKKPVVQIDPNTLQIVAYYDSARDAEKQLHNCNIHKVVEQSKQISRKASTPETLHQLLITSVTYLCMIHIISLIQNHISLDTS